MNSKTIGRYVLAAVFGLPAFFFLYMFFKLVFNFWLSDIVAVLPAAVATGLMIEALLRSKANAAIKALTASVILTTIIALVIKLLSISVVLGKLMVIANNQ